MTESDDRSKSLYRELLSNVSATIPESQDDLGPGDLIRVALEPLMKAEEKLRDLPQTKGRGKALTDLLYAIGYARSALELLRQEQP